MERRKLHELASEKSKNDSFAQLKGFKEREFIHALKAFAIFSVICAHVASVDESFSTINIYLGRVLTTVGTIGVVVFLVVSGYLFSGNKYSFFLFMKKRAVRLMLPWFFCGSMVYLYVFLRKNEIGLRSYLQFMIGKGSYLYYVTVLFVLYLFAFAIRRNKIAIVLLLVLSVSSIFCTALTFIPREYAYINPLNWLTYFMVGLIIGDYHQLERIVVFIRMTFPFWILGSLGILYFASKGDLDISSYWTKDFPFFVLFSFMSIVGICSSRAVQDSRLIIFVGKESYSIYLLHMPLAGIVNHLCNSYDYFPLTAIKPFVVLFATAFSIALYIRIVMMFRKSDFLINLIGARKP